MSDEIRTADDIISIWHVEPKLAKEMFDLFSDIVFEETCDTLFSDDESESTDASSDDEIDTSFEDE